MTPMQTLVAPPQGEDTTPPQTPPHPVVAHLRRPGDRRHRHLRVHVPLSPFRSCRCPMTLANRHVPLAPFPGYACPMTVEGTPESKCFPQWSSRGLHAVSPKPYTASHDRLVMVNHVGLHNVRKYNRLQYNQYNEVAIEPQQNCSPDSLRFARIPLQTATNITPIVFCNVLRFPLQPSQGENRPWAIVV